MKTGNLTIKSVVIDTEIFLRYYNDEEGADKVERILRKIDSGEFKAAISTITLSELYYIVGRENRKFSEEIFTELINSNLEIIDLKKNTARVVGEFKLKYSKANDPLPIADAIIAATAFVEKVPVLGEDEHFKKIREIGVVSVDDIVTQLSGT